MTQIRAPQRLRLSFTGEGFQGGAVPVTLLAAKLQALQHMVFHAAAAVKRDTSARRGLWFNRYREATELTFAASHHSDLVVELDVGSAVAVLGEEFDLGERALDVLFEFGNSVQQGFQGFQEIDVRDDDKAYLLRAIEGFLPNSLDDYRISLEDFSPKNRPRLVFSGRTRDSVRAFLIPDAGIQTEEPITLVGELVKIHIGIEPEKIAIKHKGQEIDCFYPDALRDQIADLMAGSMVEVTGDAILDNQGNPLKLNRLYDVSTVSMDPLRVTRFEHEGVPFPLKTPLVVDVQYVDDLWVYRCGRINLWGYGERREDALRDLHENFAYLWREFASEKDDVLDARAAEIKRVLLEITNKQPPGA